MLYRENPTLDEGELAKRRASLVSSVALAEVARAIGLGEHVRLGRGEELTGGRDKSSILADTLEAIIGAAYLDLGGDEATELVLRLIRPLMENPDRFGAAMDPKTSLQELAARLGRGLPYYLVTDSGPDHSKRFHADRAARAAGHRRGRRHEQEAGRDGRRARGLDAAAGASRLPELPEVEVVRAGLAPVVTGATVASVAVFDERSLRRHDGPAEDFMGRLTGARFTGASRRGKFLWLPMVSPSRACRDRPSEALVIHLGMSGQVLVRPPDTDDERTRVRFDLDSGRAHQLRRPADLRLDDHRPAGRSRPRPSTCPPRSRTSPATRSTRSSTTAHSCARLLREAHHDQARAARPDPDLRHRQHLRRRGAVAGEGALRPAAASGCRARARSCCSPRCARC